jgi:hypothetical protein
MRTALSGGVKLGSFFAIEYTFFHAAKVAVQSAHALAR